MAIVGDTLPHCTGTGTQADPYIFNSEIGFMEAIAVEGCYIEAAQSDYTFDSNNGVVLAPLYFKFAYLNAKGLTILNLISNQTEQPLITLPDNYDRTIIGLNIYNYCYVIYSNTGNLTYIISSDWKVYGGTSKKATFSGCNFAGIVIGHSPSYNLFGYRDWSNHDWSILDMEFLNCTFNIHFSDPNYNQFHEGCVFCGDNHNPLVLKNCTVCLSGDAPQKGVMVTNGYSSYWYAKFDTVTITNTQSNPLRCYRFRGVTAQFGYNYYKLYITTFNTGSSDTNITINDALALINKSRFTLTAGTMSLTGIVMQEDDPTATDYIYNEQNLANAGFLVGQVIT